MPKLIVLTDRAQAGADLLAVLASAVAGGARWVLLRERDLPYPRRFALALRLRRMLAPVGGRLLVAGPDPLGGDAVHLAARDPCVPVPLLGRSCHDAAELDRLSTEDYVTLSPVFPTRSKPRYGPPLGRSGLARLVPLAGGRPTYALGGVSTPARAAACVAAGAGGVAVMGAVMRAADPARSVRELLAAL